MSKTLDAIIKYVVLPLSVVTMLHLEACKDTSKPKKHHYFALAGHDSLDYENKKKMEDIGMKVFEYKTEMGMVHLIVDTAYLKSPEVIKEMEEYEKISIKKDTTTYRNEGVDPKRATGPYQELPRASPPRNSRPPRGF
jgi:hypothetical protein